MVLDDSISGKLLNFLIRITGKEEMVLNEITNYYLFFERDGVYYPINEIFVDRNMKDIIFKSTGDDSE